MEYYKTDYVKDHNYDIEELLNRRVGEGWRLHTLVHRQDNIFIAVFERIRFEIVTETETTGATEETIKEDFRSILSRGK